MIESEPAKRKSPIEKETPQTTEEFLDLHNRLLTIKIAIQELRLMSLEEEARTNQNELSKLNKKIFENRNVLTEGLRSEFRSLNLEALAALNELPDIKLLDPELHNWALATLENTVALTEIIQEYRKDPENAKGIYTFLLAVDNLIIYGDHRQVKLGLEILSKNTDALDRRMEQGYTLTMAPFLERIIVSGEKDAAEKALIILWKHTVDTDTGRIVGYDLLGWCFATQTTRVKELAESIIITRLKNLNILAPEKYPEAWRVSAPDSIWSLSDILQKNIATIESLESNQPGAANFLNREFGIFDFGRYSSDMLLQQYEERDNDTIRTA